MGGVDFSSWALATAGTQSLIGGYGILSGITPCYVVSKWLYPVQEGITPPNLKRVFYTGKYHVIDKMYLYFP